MRYIKEGPDKGEELRPKRKPTARGARAKTARRLAREVAPVQPPVSRAERMTDLLLSSKPTGLTHEQWAPVVDLLSPTLASTKLSEDTAKKVARIVGVSAVVPIELGLDLDYEAILSPDAVERFLATEGAGLSEHSRRNYLGAVRLLGRALHLPQYPEIIAKQRIPRNTRNLFYTAIEKALYERAAEAIPDDDARADAAWMVKLAFRIGMNATQQQFACGTDLHPWSTHWAIWVVRPDGTGLIERPVPDDLAPELCARAREVGFRHIVNLGEANRRVYAKKPREDLHRADPRLANFVVQQAATRGPSRCSTVWTLRWRCRCRAGRPPARPGSTCSRSRPRRPGTATSTS